ncbi:MAG: hypothetical protein KAI47_00085 [Deltaproteobacteria bacterium]|nr:hypothetical protein [Deltaproteobacteria bacterium]
MRARFKIAILCLPLLMTSTACGDDNNAVNSEEEARRAYMLLDKMVEKAMDLGFKGFNAATSANIPAQTDKGAVQGTINVTGQVDHGASNNKGMRLFVELIDYADDKDDQDHPMVVYVTGAQKPALNMQLKKIPTGTMDGTLTGGFKMAGHLQGEVVLNLTLISDLEADSASAGGVRRKAGTVQVTGTATSPYGTYNVNLTR